METTNYTTEKFQSKAIIITPSQYIDKDLLVISKQHYKYVDKVVITKGMMADRVDKLALDLYNDYTGKTVYFVVIMKGALTFANLLTDSISNLINNDQSKNKMNFFVEYISVNSYANGQSTGVVTIKIDEKVLEKVKNKNVVIIEDTYDTGLTMDKILAEFKSVELESIRTAVLVHKMNPKNLVYDYIPEYIGFLTPNGYVLGQGFDYEDHFRNLNHICTFFSEELKNL
jgi:hypoxanthine phosphoribosyltransferase